LEESEIITPETFVPPPDKPATLTDEELHALYVAKYSHEGVIK
jgi:hypothetical protein